MPSRVKAITPSAALKGFLIAGFLTTGQWTMLSRLGAGVLAIAVLLAALELRPEWFEARRWAAVRWPGWTALLPGAPSPMALLIGVAAAAPTWIHLALTRNQEYGFSGDDPYHFSAARAYAVHLSNAGPALLVLGAAIVLATRRVGRGHATAVFFAGLFALSFAYMPVFAFARYPATFYLIATPLNVAADVLKWQSPVLANHITNALAIPAWLFVLRPIVVRRWPDLTVLPTIALLMFQKEVVYYFTYGVIEPWALVVWLTAIEALIVCRPEHRWIPFLMVAFAALIKETTVFLMPVVWALSGGVDLRERRIEWRTVAFGAALLSPFVVFYVLRRRMALIRTVGPGGWHEVTAAGRVSEFVSALHFQYGSAGLVLLTALWVCWMVGLYQLRREGFLLALHSLLGVAALGLVAFFYSDEMSIPFTAYSRYLLFPLFVFGATLLVAGDRLRRAGRMKTLVTASVLIVAFQAFPLASALALDFRPDYARNSREWPHVPVYLPIRALVSQIADLPGGAAVRRIKIVTYGFDATLAPHVYPDLNRRYALRAEQQMVDAPDCACRAADEGVLGGFEARTLLALANGNQGDFRVFAAEQSCVAQLETTCASTRTVRHDDGTVVGVLGVGARPD
jgi:hypothetical protein